MRESTNVLEGVSLNSVHAGSVIEVDTINTHYRIEYLGENAGRISGHPQLCPRPMLVEIQGSIGDSIQEGFIGQGMHLIFRRVDDARPITTSEITGVRVAA